MLMYIDESDILSNYGIFVQEEFGLFSPLTVKGSWSRNWPDEHGEIERKDDQPMKPRKFKIKMGVQATTIAQFNSRIGQFFDLFTDVGARQLRLEHYNRVWMVHVAGMKPFQRQTHFNAVQNVGLFTMNFIEPEPVNRQFYIPGLFTTVAVTGSGQYVYTIFWGDGTWDYVSVATGGVGHAYGGGGGTAVVCGRIDKATTITATSSTERTW